MSDVTLPAIGQEPWGEDLNAYLTNLHSQVMSNAEEIAVNTARITNNTTLLAQQAVRISEVQTALDALTAQVQQGRTDINANTAAIANLSARVTALEARPDYVYGQATYMFSSAAPPATGSQIRLNNPTPQNATMLDVRRLDADGQDRSMALELITPGTLIRLSEFADASKWYRFKATGNRTFQGADNINIPVTWHSGAGTLGNTKINVTMFIVVPPQ